MNKNCYISLFFLLAFGVLFLHSITPHHHEDDNIINHSGTHDDHDDDSNTNALSHAFGSFQHFDGGNVIYEAAPSAFKVAKVITDKGVLFFIQQLKRFIEKPPLIHYEHDLFISFLSPCLHNQQFRGPPYLIV